jgi:hypothetical protein
LRPGEDFDQRGDWAEILGPAGWQCVATRGDERRWRRPGKDGPGWSATTGRCRGKDGADLLRVFSSNAAPLEDGKAYGKFRSYTLLHHNGDFTAAARDLAAKGYGARHQSGAGPERNGEAHAPSTSGGAPPEPGPWPEPLPIPDAMVAPPFPVDVLPDELARFVERGATALSCPCDYLGLPLIVLAGARVGSSRALQIKPGWRERPSMYGAVVGPPSAGKTPALKLVAAPVYREQARLHEEYRRERRDREGDPKAPKPAERAVFVADSTTEKLAELLQDNPRGLVMIRDELVAWVAGLNQYKAKGAGADRQFYLSAWAGEPVSVHRKNQQAGPVFVAHPFLSVVGGLPPDLLPRLRGDKDVADGFFDRILFSYPDPHPSVGETWDSVPDDAVELWADVLCHLGALSPEALPEGGVRPHYVRLTESGERAWERFTRGLAADLNDECLPDCLRGPWAKFRGYCARLALVLHLLRQVMGNVSGEDVDGGDVDRAAELVTYFQGHARKVYAAMAADRATGDARRIIRWLRRFCESVNSMKGPEKQETVSKQQIHANVFGGSRELADVERAIDVAVRHGYLRQAQAAQKTGPGRAPSPRYEVHPSLLHHD